MGKSKSGLDMKFDYIMRTGLESVVVCYKVSRRMGNKRDLRDCDAYALRLVNGMTQDESLRKEYIEFYDIRKEVKK